MIRDVIVSGSRNDQHFVGAHDKALFIVAMRERANARVVDAAVASQVIWRRGLLSFHTS